MADSVNRWSIISHLKPFIRGRLPGQLIIQLTDACNASCPQCGMRRTAPFRRSTLSLDDGKRIIDHAAASGISALSITGGEPFLFCKELVALIRHAGEAGITFIRTGTNGYLFMGHDRPDFPRRIAQLAETLAATTLYTLWISMDSATAEIHERMRGLPGVIKGIEKSLPIFHEHGIFPSANLGITKNVILPYEPAIGAFNGAAMSDYRRGFRAFFNRVIEMGFTIANACYPMSIGENAEGNLSAVYEATADADLVRFSVDEKVMVMRAFRETVPEFRSRIRIFTPLSSLRALERQHSGKAESCQPCRGGSDFFFVDAAGCDTFPCGYRGADNLGKFWDLDLKRPPLPANCLECDWECFRDPSELFGPFADIFSKPGETLAAIIREPSVLTARLSDLRYYLACDMFNGRVPPDYRKLGRFESKRQ